MRRTISKPDPVPLPFHRRMRETSHGSGTSRSRRPSPHSRALYISDLNRFALRTAYTLIEMLVAVALVMLLMSIFAGIFQIAAGSISTQRGIATNDQRSRSVSIVLRNDLDKRTFRSIVPYAAWPSGSGSYMPPVPNVSRRGYFYISENDVGNDLDDVLQFTVDAEITRDNRDKTPYYGLATLITGDEGSGSKELDFLQNANQPEADDGSIQIDSTGSSTVAEVSYFVRNRNLYRRVLLVRRPLSVAGSDPNPTDAAGTRMFNHEDNGNARTSMSATYPITEDCRIGIAETDTSFWAAWDYSAYYSSSNGAQFHQFSDSLVPVLFTDFPAARTLCNPRARFGHDQANGLPREYLDPDANSPQFMFLGRFTHEETSHRHFNWPQGLCRGDTGGVNNNGNPMDFASADGTRPDLNDVDNDGVVDEFANGPRRAEDLLMTNVHAFDVKVWDPLYNEDDNGDGTLDADEDYNGNGKLDWTDGTNGTGGAFVDVGHAAAESRLYRAGSILWQIVRRPARAMGRAARWHLWRIASWTLGRRSWMSMAMVVLNRLRIAICELTLTQSLATLTTLSFRFRRFRLRFVFTMSRISNSGRPPSSIH